MVNLKKSVYHSFFSYSIGIPKSKNEKTVLFPYSFMNLIPKNITVHFLYLRFIAQIKNRKWNNRPWKDFNIQFVWTEVIVFFVCCTWKFNVSLQNLDTWRGKQRGSRHKVCSSGNNHRSSRHGGSAGPKGLRMEPNVGHLKFHKPKCVNCVRRAEVICRLWPVITTDIFLF